jgi:hypothetical protein
MELATRYHDIAGKAPMKAEEFLRGTPLKPPMRLA